MNYTYNSTSNKILKVDDASSETASFRDVTGNDYDYWLDGSLKKDNNKDIAQIDYNYLKLPKQIFLTGGRWIKYEYDASGTKLKKTLSTGKVTDYEEDEIYEDGVLYQTSHDEGRIVEGIYEYNITDHLGNNRISFRDFGGVAQATQVNHVGAWGEPLEGLNVINTPKINNFTLSTYEKENDFGIGIFDAHARVFDPVTPRFWSIDPLSELSRRFSPFVYNNNNPLRFIDPDGMMVRGLIDDLWDKSGDNTTWMNNGNGSFEGDNGQTVQDDKGKKEEANKMPSLKEAMARPHLNPNGDGIQPNYTIESTIIGGKIFKPVGTLFGKLWGGIFGKASTSIWDDIVATQANYPGSVLPKSFELTTSQGVKIWVHGNATEHIAEFLQMKAINSTPEVVRLVTQIELQSLQGAVNSAIKNGIPYNQLINMGGWELKFVAPRVSGQLPALIHALPK